LIVCFFSLILCLFLIVLHVQIKIEIECSSSFFFSKIIKRHRGDLNLPSTIPAEFTPELKEELVTGPGMNAEAVVVECLRNNTALCQDAVPRDLLEEFGLLVDISPDPTSCINLEFLTILCAPNGEASKPIPRNQVCVSKLATNMYTYMSSSYIPYNIVRIFFLLFFCYLFHSLFFLLSTHLFCFLGNGDGCIVIRSVESYWQADS
jgi:hypothetical protein